MEKSMENDKDTGIMCGFIGREVRNSQGSRIWGMTRACPLENHICVHIYIYIYVYGSCLYASTYVTQGSRI